jgi:L-seryl-tRNA(Ser) seleniumtransferase
MHIYERLGVTPIINAKGAATRLSGALMAPEVTAAMVEAAEYCVDIAELQARAGSVIAEATGAQAGYVTSGAAAGLLLSAAACVARLEPARMAQLPNTTGLANEVIMVRSQRNAYDHAIRSAGVTLVEVGLPDRHAGAGMRDGEPWEIVAAINDKTAAVFYVAGRDARPALRDVVEVAHDAGLPVIVDAAAQLPPAANLRRFIDDGADLVAFSGGKTIGGPQATGILAGRRDLIMSAALQHLDHDVFADQWQPPAQLIDKSLIKGVPHNGIGRPCKVGREGIAGLLAALELFLAEGDDVRHARWLARCTTILDGLKGLNSVESAITGGGDVSEIPMVELKLSPAAPMSALELTIALQNASPAVHVDPTFADRGEIHISPICLRDDQVPLVAPAIGARFGH